MWKWTSLERFSEAAARWNEYAFGVLSKDFQFHHQFSHTPSGSSRAVQPSCKQRLCEFSLQGPLRGQCHCFMGWSDICTPLFTVDIEWCEEWVKKMSSYELQNISPLKRKKLVGKLLNRSLSWPTGERFVLISQFLCTTCQSVKHLNSTMLRSISSKFGYSNIAAVYIVLT